MASGGGGSDLGDWEYYKILVSGIPSSPNFEALLRTRFQDKFGRVVHVRSHPPTCAIVTLTCPAGQSHTVPRELKYSELGGSILTLYNLGTEKTTLTMGNFHPVAIEKLVELAPAYQVACVPAGESAVHLCGLMDNVYNLRSEVDAFLLGLAQPSTSSSPQPQENASSHVFSSNTSSHLPSGEPNYAQPPPEQLSHTHPPLGHAPKSDNAAPQSSIPLHLQQAPFGVSSPGAHQQPTAFHHTTITPPVTSSYSAIVNPTTSPAPQPTPQSSAAPPPMAQPTSTPISSHQYQPATPATTATTAPNAGKPYSTPGHETYTTPPSSPMTASKLVPGTTSAPTHDPSSPPPPGLGVSSPPQGSGSPVDQEMSNVFTNLNGDALALLERLPEGDIPGVQYNAKAGSVQIQLNEKSDVDDAISKFQEAYKKVALSRDRRLRVEYVDVPMTTTKEEVLSQVAKFEQQYRFCAFVFEEEKQQVKVISQARQFEQAKQFFRDALQQTVGSSGSTAAEMVITLPKNRRLTLKKANIVEEEVDIIVNAANGSLLHGGGVAGALNAASHGLLQKYCTRYMERTRKGDEIPVGEVAVTHGGGALKCKHVIHAVGPDSITHSPSVSEQLIQLAIHNTLKAAEKYNATSIAIPALSCGIFGVSKKIVARSITDTILGFQFTKPLPALSDIRIVIIDESTHSCFAHYFARLLQSTAKGTAALSGPSSSAKGSTEATGQGKKGELTIKDMPLSMKDLTWLMMQLKAIAPKWKEVVMELSPSNDQLLSMMGGSSDPVLQLTKGLTRWLMQTTPTPTLGALTRALCSKAVGEREKASEIVKAGYQEMKLRAEDSSSAVSDVKYPKLPPDDSTNGASGVSHPDNTNDHGAGAGHQGNTASAHAKEEDCPICLDTFKSPIKTKCGHKFCSGCIEKALQYDPYCPSCKKPLRPITGKQPPGGTMRHMILPYCVPGYEGYKTIQITYDIPSGTQGPEHPNPGQPYHGTSRVAYLPDNDDGRQVFLLLQKAFQARLIFTVGTSVTSGAQNVVVWNDIHHKTNISGGQQGYGYPDPTYLQRVKEDLAAKGIVLDSSVV